MPIDRSKMRKGAEAIDQANDDVANRKDFKPFLPAIYWGGDGDERYVLILNPIEEIPQVDFHPFVDTGDGIPHQIIARTDPIIGEKSDPIEKNWQYKTRLTNLCIAAELEPLTKLDSKGRKKPIGFEIKTNTFERRIRDDDGELTDEKEEVTAPIVGLISQSPINFFNQLRQYDATESEIHTTPLKITRLGKKDVTYTVIGYESTELKVDNLLDYVENISYVKDPEVLLERLDGLDDKEACVEIGNYLLDLKIDELADEENYNELYEEITEPSKYPAKGSKGKTKGKTKEKTARPARQSQRKQKQADDVPAETDDTKEAKTEAAPADKQSDREVRLARLRDRSAAKKKKTDDSETE